MENRKAQLAVVVLMLGGVCSSPALALPPMGPPKATLEKNQWAVDFRYAHQEMELDSSGKTQEIPPGSCEYQKYKIEDLTTSMFLGSLGYGICENWDAFVFAGAANAEDDITETKPCGGSGSQYYGFSGDYKAAWGFGTRTTFCQDGNLTWGGLFQMAWSDIDGSNLKLRGAPDFSGDVDLDFWEIQVAAGPTLQLDGFSVYGGPFLHFVKGDMDLKGTTAGSSVRTKADIREESVFGAYVGSQWDIDEDTSWFTEYQFTGDAWGVGMGIVWRF